MRVIPLSLAFLALVPAGVSACASSSSSGDTSSSGNSRHVGISLREATALVQAFENKQVPPQKKIPAPTSLDEARAVLKSDRIDAFPDAVAFLSGQQGHDAAALKAQILLAWGEAELTVAEVLGDTADRLDEGVRGLQVKKSTPDVQHKLEAERARVQLYRDTDEALRLLAAEHVAAGVEESDKVIKEKPDDYVGYRIAADAHRLRDEWKEFAEMTAKVEQTNPDSNGLVFLRGVAAQFRDNDPAEAIKLFKQALEKDPQFVRAQAQLVLVSPTIFSKEQELKKLKEIAPDHQIVRWAGPGIDEAYQKAAERQQQLQDALANRPGTPTSPAAKP
jgi:tetratricopeptide (TPR) repeat protein